MSLYRTQAPRAPLRGSLGGIIEWARNLVAFLDSQETRVASELEAILALGGEEVATRMFGFEGSLLTPTPPEEAEIMAAPVAGKKKIITDFILTCAATTAMSIRLFKLKGATEYDLVSAMDLEKKVPFTGASTMKITLDDINESIRLEVLTGTDDVHWNGSYLDVD